MMQSKSSKAIMLTLNVVMTLILLFPLMYALSVSFMTAEDIFASPVRLFPSAPTFNHYVEAVGYFPIVRFLLNSLFVSIAVTVGQIVTSNLTAFAFAFFDFKGKKIMFFLVLATMMIPWESIIISNYLTMSQLQWLDQYRALIVPYFTSAFGIFLIRQHYLTVPKELYEAARIDGMSNFAFLMKILVPISKPVIVSLSIYTFLNTWNQYLWPLLVTSDDKVRTVQIGVSMLKFSEGLNFGLVMAGIIMVILPSILLFLIGHRQLVAGLTDGSVKG